MKIYEGYYNERPSTTDIKRVDIIRYSVTEPTTDDIKQYLEDNSQPYFESAQEKQEFYEENTFFDIEALDADYEELFTLSDVSLSELKNIFDYRIVNMILNSEGRQISQAEKELCDLLDFSLDNIDLNDVESVNKAAKQIFGESIYLNGFEGYILTDGTCIHFGKDKDHASISAIYSRETGESMTPGRFVALGNIRIRRNNINLEKCPTLKQIKPLKELISYYKKNDVYLEVSEYDFSKNNMYGNSILNVVFNRPHPDGVTAQIVRYFKEGIKPSGSIVYETTKQKRLDYLISSNLITLNEANNEYYNNRLKLDFFYPLTEYYEHITIEDLHRLFESDGINHRFDSIFDELVSLILDGYNHNLSNKSLEIETEYVYNSSIKRLKGETEESFILRCCEPESMHKDDKGNIDVDWHPIDIVLFDKIEQPVGTAGNRHGLGDNIKTHSSYYKNDRIKIYLNIRYIPRTEYDIANVLQHELTHIIDLFNGINYHIYNKRSMIRTIDDMFDLSATVSVKLFERLSKLGYYIARCEQVAHFNGIYKYVKYKYNFNNYSVINIYMDMNRLTNINDMMSIKFLLLDDDTNIDDSYNGSFVMLFLLIAYYLKFHKISIFKTNSRYIDYDWINDKLDLFREFIIDNDIDVDSKNINDYINIGKYITIDDLKISVNDYLRIKKGVIDCISEIFNSYSSEVKAKVNKALRENSLNEI